MSKRIKESPGIFEGLSPRIRNSLRWQGFNTVNELREALLSGKLDNLPNFGSVSKEELRVWLEKNPR